MKNDCPFLGHVSSEGVSSLPTEILLMYETTKRGGNESRDPSRPRCSSLHQDRELGSNRERLASRLGLRPRVVSSEWTRQNENLIVRKSVALDHPRADVVECAQMIHR